MSWEEIKGKWNQYSGKLKEQFGKLSDDEVIASEGHREILVGKLQEKYGYSHAEAEQKLSLFVNEHYTGIASHKELDVTGQTR